MKIVSRYILREFIESFLFGLIVFSGILLLDQIFQLINLLLSKGISIFTVAKLFALILPNILSLTIPMAVLFGILLSYGRLSEDNEITALRSTGVAYRSFTLPVLSFVLVLSAFMLYFNQTLSPQTHREFRNMYQAVLKQRPLLKFDDKAITNLGEYRLYVQKSDKNTGTLHGVNIYKFTPGEDGIPWRITASSANVTVTPTAVIFDLHQGFWQKPSPQKPGRLIHLNFVKYRFSIQTGNSIIPTSQSLREMTSREIGREIQRYHERKMPTNFLENEYWLRITLAAAPVVFALIGIPLGIVSEKGGKSIGFGLSLLVIFVYYLLLVTGLNIGEKGYVPPAIILWLPDIVPAAVGILLWRTMLRR